MNTAVPIGVSLTMPASRSPVGYPPVADRPLLLPSVRGRDAVGAGDVGQRGHAGRHGAAAARQLPLVLQLQLPQLRQLLLLL